MTRIRVDEVLRDKLRNFSEPIEICDEHDVVIARVEPVVGESQDEPWIPEFDEEELQRREKSDKRFSTAEVLARLERLEEEGK